METDVADANDEAIQRIAGARPFLVDVRPAGEAIAGLGAGELLHAGPPLAGWAEACGPLRGAVLGTLVLKGLAADAAEAEAMADAGTVRLRSAHDVGALGTFGGVIGRRTAVFVVENRAAGTRAFSAINEGRGKALRYGSNAKETLDRLAWIEGEFAEILGAAVRRADGIDLFAIVEQALHMGDEGHSRQKAASALFLAAVAPWIAGAGYGTEAAQRVLRFLAANDFFFLPLAMAGAKTAAAAAEGIPKSTLVTAIAFNGVRAGIRVSGLGARWWTAPVPAIRGQYFEGYGEPDAGPVIGDSEIAETIGLGAFAITGAPALAKYVGGSIAETRRLTEEMYAITIGEHPRFTIPILDHRGTPLGIDASRVVASGTEPVFSTGIAHKTPGVGQIGAGFGRVPLACFRQAVAALAGG